MSVTSTMLSLDSPAPDFSLKEVTNGKTISKGDFEAKKGLLVMFICRHCPYVQHVREELAHIGRNYENRDLGIAAISSNDADAYFEDNPNSLSEMAKESGFTFPLLYDETQETAKKYKAACTPDFFLFNKERKLVYRGQLDGSRPGNGIPVTGGDLRRAIEAVLNDRPVNEDQKPSAGCSIKWKPGNEPDYFG